MRTRILISALRLGYSAVPKNAQGEILEVFKSGQFSPGPKVREFERKWAEIHKAKHAVFVNSGTDALRLSLLALKEKYGWQDGDLIAVPALTFVASVNAIIQSNLTPFFVDVGMHDYTINPHNLERLINTSYLSTLRAVMPVHLFGQSCDPYIYEVAKKYGNLKVIEDSCETIANPLKGQVSCYSTYMAHHVTTGVGGFAVTSDDELNLLIRSYANHGRNVGYLPGYKTPKLTRDLLKSRFRFDRRGYSCRGTEFEAALGLSQMEHIEGNVMARQLIASLMVKALEGFSQLQMPTAKQKHTFMMFPILIKETCKIDKYDLCYQLEKAGIETRDMMPITSQPCFQTYLKERTFSVADGINKRGFYIACNPGMTRKDIQHIQNTFGSYLTK